MKISEYKAPLVVICAGALGVLMLCGLAAIAFRRPEASFRVQVDRADLIRATRDHFAAANASTEQMSIEYVPTLALTNNPALTAASTYTMVPEALETLRPGRNLQILADAQVQSMDFPANTADTTELNKTNSDSFCTPVQEN